jgi:hypothetical protein
VYDDIILATQIFRIGWIYRIKIIMALPASPGKEGVFPLNPEGP